MSKFVICLVLSVCCFGQIRSYRLEAPDMAVLAKECMKQDSKSSPIEFQLDGYCMLFICTITQKPAGPSAAVRTLGCGGASSKYPCYITELNMNEPYPACCPRTQCPK